MPTALQRPDLGPATPGTPICERIGSLSMPTLTRIVMDSPIRSGSIPVV